jgi:hypothetical protein
MSEKSEVSIVSSNKKEKSNCECCKKYPFFLFITTHQMLAVLFIHTPRSTPLTRHKSTMVSLRTIMPLSITLPTDQQWPPNLFQPLPNIHTHHLMHRQLQCHSRFHVWSTQLSWTYKFTIPLLATSSNSRWSRFTSDLHQTTPPCFWISRESISYVLVSNRWVIFAQESKFSV